MKKRSCRRTDEESNIHDQADSQLVDAFAKKYTDGYEKGLTEAKSKAPEGMSASDLVQRLKDQTIRGIGKVTIKKLEDIIYAG